MIFLSSSKSLRMLENNFKYAMDISKFFSNVSLIISIRLTLYANHVQLKVSLYEEIS
jgi:hypothetical protein